MKEASFNKALLQVTRLSAGYGDRWIVKDVSLRISEGESVALIGSNGCGKSTFLRTIAGLVAAHRGEVLLEGGSLNLGDASEGVLRGLGYLKQTNNVFTGLTVRGNLELAGRSTHDALWVEQRLDGILKTFPKLTSCLESRAGLLSGGQKKALAVAMVLMRPARLLLLDEPVAGLSSNLGGELLLTLRKTQKAEGFAMVIVEHALRVVHPYVDRVLVMREGALVDNTTDTNRMLNASWVAGHYQNRTGSERKP